MPKTWTAEEVERVLVIAQDVVSLNAPVMSTDGDEETELANFIEDPAPNPEEITIANCRKDELITIMTKYLPVRERDVLLMRYGFASESPMTLQEIGDYYKITRERARQIEARALRRLRLALYRRNIKSVEDF